MSLLKPQSGNIFINDELATQFQWTNKISYAPQTPVIYNSSLEDNLHGYSLQESKYAPFLEDIDSSQKLDVEKLSGGQKSRIGITRALMEDSEIVFLDEPIASIDNVKKQLLETYISNDPRTFIIITHQDLSLSCEIKRIELK